MFNRKVRSKLPMLPSKFNTLVDTQSLLEREDMAKDKSIIQFNTRHRSKNLSNLSIGDFVWVTDLRVYAKVTGVLEEPRSYEIESILGGVYRRNRWNLIPAPYYTQQRFTPTLSPPKVNQPQDYDGNCIEHSQGVESVMNNSDQSEVPRDINFETSVESANVNLDNSPISPSKAKNKKDSLFPCPRPKREIKQPCYLNDYILD